MDASERWAKNRALAEKLGWRLEKGWIIGSTNNDFKWMAAPSFVVTDDMKYQEGRSGTRYVEIPDFWGSLDACAEVLPKEASIVLRFVKGTFKALVLIFPSDDKQMVLFHGEGDTRAEALADTTERWAEATRSRRADE